MPAKGASNTQSDTEGDWICANCGTVHESNNQPCRSCTSERFARLEPEQTPTIDSTNAVEFRCEECGRHSPRNGTPCHNCGSLSYESVDASESAQEWNDPSSSRRVTALSIMTYLYGGAFVLLGLLWLLEGQIVSGSLSILGAAIAMPASRNRAEQSFNIDFSGGAVVLTIILLHMGAFVFAS